MQNTTEKSSRSAEGLYKFFIYFVLVLLAVTIIVPVAWVFMASIKQNAELYGSPWALPLGVYWQNFVDAWTTARMGEFMLNSVLTTAIALALLTKEVYSSLFIGILIGGLLLMLPVSSADGAFADPIDALFTATSATCVTGLVVRDTWTQFTVFGQAVILLSLIHI